MIFAPRKLACLLFLLVVCAQTPAQQPVKPKPSPTPSMTATLSVSTRMWCKLMRQSSIKTEKIVADLKAEDFEITEEEVRT